VNFELTAFERLANDKLDAVINRALPDHNLLGLVAVSRTGRVRRWVLQTVCHRSAQQIHADNIDPKGTTLMAVPATSKDALRNCRRAGLALESRLQACQREPITSFVV
jgi:hypothetical protein